MQVTIPPKSAIAQVVGYLKGKSAILIARTHMGRTKNFRASILRCAGILHRQMEWTRRPSTSISDDSRGKIVF